MDTNVEIDELRTGCAKIHKKIPHSLCTAENEGPDVDFDMLDHGEVSFWEREHWLAEFTVVEMQGVLPVEDRERFFVECATGSEDIGEDVMILARTCPRKDTIGFERVLWLNQKLLVDFDT